MRFVLSIFDGVIMDIGFQYATIEDGQNNKFHILYFKYTSLMTISVSTVKTTPDWTLQ